MHHNSARRTKNSSMKLTFRYRNCCGVCAKQRSPYLTLNQTKKRERFFACPSSMKWANLIARKHSSSFFFTCFHFAVAFFCQPRLVCQTALRRKMALSLATDSNGMRIIGWENIFRRKWQRNNHGAYGSDGMSQPQRARGVFERRRRNRWTRKMRNELL